MEQIEQNDVDISKLFEWKKRFEIHDRYGKKVLDVYIRLVGDADSSRARVYGLRSSAILRRNLKNIDSEDRQALIPDISVIEKEFLVESLLLLQMRKFSEEALNSVDIPLPVEPVSDADLEIQEKYQKEVDEYPEIRSKLIKEHMEKKVDTERSRLSKVKKEKLYNKYVEESIDNMCEIEMVTKYREKCCYYGTFNDADLTVRSFKDFDRFDNVPTHVKDQLVEAYMSLEIDGPTLKKSLGATL